MSTPIHIVGHSPGAWSGAHLSQRLSEWDYRVEILVTQTQWVRGCR